MNRAQTRREQHNSWQKFSFDNAAPHIARSAQRAEWKRKRRELAAAAKATPAVETKPRRLRWLIAALLLLAAAVWLIVKGW